MSQAFTTERNFVENPSCKISWRSCLVGVSVVEKEAVAAHRGITRLRFVAAINVFKQLLLGDRNVLGRAQTEALFDVISGLTETPPFDARTWQNWNGVHPPAPRPGKVLGLDQLAFQFHGSQQTAQEAVFDRKRRLPFSEMVHGGLMQRLVAPTKSKSTPPHRLLLDRAAAYSPCTAFHLHLDAIEAASWTREFAGNSWSTVARIGAQRVLEILWGLWSPREGNLYQSFRSDFRNRWDSADALEKQEIERDCAQLTPNPFKQLIEPGAWPDSTRVYWESDIAPAHIYKLLLSLAGDPDFLVAERFDAWCLDLITAGLAMHAQAWTNAYTTMGGRAEDELLFWMAFDTIFFSNSALDPDGWYIQPAFARMGINYSPEIHRLFNRARDDYRSNLAQMASTPEEVCAIAMGARDMYPLVFKG